MGISVTTESLQEEPFLPTQLETFKLRLRHLINEQLAPPRGYSPIHLPDFKNIIFSGTAPQSEFQKLREPIIEAVPELSGRFIKETIEPGWVAAVGAARRAEQDKLEGPVLVDDGFYAYDKSDAAKHNEL